jgi:NADPH:quinone reductase-like Zn-dependent oxidoreductase
VKVAGVREFGGPQALELVEVPEPVPGPGEVRVRVHAATVNPTDTYLRNGAYRKLLKHGPPWVAGMEAAGVLDAVGEGADVGDLRIGDPVVAIVLPTGPRGGAYAEQVVVPAGSVARAPSGASHAEAATLPMNGLTAQLTLDMLALAPGQTLAVTGAAGAYGGLVIQLAKDAGLRVLADASDRDRELVTRLGADVVVPRGDDVAARLRELAPGGVDALADGSVQEALVLPAIRDGGQIAAVRPFTAELERGITLRQVWVHTYATEQAKLDRLCRLAEKGALDMRVARTFPAAEAAEAHRVLQAGGTRGRLVLEF